MESFPGHNLIWTGSYTADSGGIGTGIGAVTAAADGTLRWLGDAAAADSPSFLAVHPSLPVVYAVAEQARTVRAYRRSGQFGFVPAGPVWPAGDAACHAAVDPSGRFLVVCCWGDGQVLFYELDGDGGIVDRAAAAPSRDPHGDGPGGERRPSRAHAALMLADGRVMTTDLGHDLLRIWTVRPGPGPGLVLDHEVVLPQGSGPRHLVQHPGGHVFVVTEYSIDVVAAGKSPDSGDFRLVFVGPATAGGALPGDSAAEIALAADGRHAYVGVSGSNRVSALKVEADGSALRPVGGGAGQRLCQEPATTAAAWSKPSSWKPQGQHHTAGSGADWPAGSNEKQAMAAGSGERHSIGDPQCSGDRFSVTPGRTGARTTVPGSVVSPSVGSGNIGSGRVRAVNAPAASSSATAAHSGSGGSSQGSAARVKDSTTTPTLN